jgi:hypothetical protein
MKPEILAVMGILLSFFLLELFTTGFFKKPNERKAMAWSRGRSQRSPSTAPIMASMQAMASPITKAISATSYSCGT